MALLGCAVPTHTLHTRAAPNGGNYLYRAAGGTRPEPYNGKIHVCVYWLPPQLHFLVFHVVSALPGTVSTGGAATASLSLTLMLTCVPLVLAEG